MMIFLQLYNPLLISKVAEHVPEI